MSYFDIPEPCAPIPLGEFLTGKTRFPAIYLLFSRGTVVYVGQSKTLRMRIEQHLTERKKEFDAVAFIPCSVNKLTEWEGHLIRQYAPKYNACAITAKVRDKASWQAERNRKALAKGGRAPGDEDLVFMNLDEWVIAPKDVGEFLSVSDGDAKAWMDKGRIKGTTAAELFSFMMSNGAMVSKAQRRFEAL